MNRLRKSQFGFTLMELLIVVIIVGILASVAIPQFRRATDRTREAEAKNILASILTAEMAHFQENGKFTDQVGLLLVDIPSMKNWVDPTFSAKGTVGGTPDPADPTKTIGGITVTSLNDGVIVETNGGDKTTPPKGHNHSTHLVRGAVNSDGAREIVATGSF